MSSSSSGNGRATAPVIAAAAVGIIVLCIALFALVGVIRGDGDATVAVNEPGPATTPLDEAASGADDGDGSADADGSAGGSGDGAGSDGEAEADGSATGDGDTGDGGSGGEGDDETAAQGDGSGDGGSSGDEGGVEDGDGSGGENGDGSETAANDDDGGDTADADADDDDAVAGGKTSVDPASVSIQVLDAVGDGGAAARDTADELRNAGYDVVVINGASRGYSVTTVFWTEGEGPGGRAVAAALGTSEARRTPTEVGLSNSVDVHVVVGADRG